MAKYTNGLLKKKEPESVIMVVYAKIWKQLFKSYQRKFNSCPEQIHFGSGMGEIIGAKYIEVLGSLWKLISVIKAKDGSAKPWSFVSQ